MSTRKSLDLRPRVRQRCHGAVGDRALWADQLSSRAGPPPERSKEEKLVVATKK